MIVMEPMLGLMEVAMLPALNRSFMTYKLDMDIQRPTTQLGSAGVASIVKAV